MKFSAKALGLVFLLALAPPANAQVIIGGGGISGGSPGGATEIIAGNGISVLSASPCDTSCTIATTVTRNAKTSTTETIASTDGGKMVSASNSSAQAYSIVDASTAGFTAGYGTEIHNINTGLVTLTAGGASVFPNGLQTLAIFRGQSAFIWSDGTNYQAILSQPVIAADSVMGNFTAAANYPRASAALSDCDGASNALTYDVTTHAFGCNTISASAGVSSITGTANQITASASTGAVTLSLPASVQTTTLALNACTIGSNAFCAAGSVNISGAQVDLAAATILAWGTTRMRLSTPGNGFVQWGTSSSTPQAYTFGVPNGSGTNIAGAATTIIGSLGSGNANSGDLNFQTGGAVAASGTTAATATTALTIRGVNGRLSLPLLSTDATLTTRTLCQDTTSKDLYFGSGTAGICLGTSSARYKHDIVPLSLGITQIMALKPVSYKLNKDKGDPTKTLYGFLAEDMQKVVPKLVGLNKKGQADTADYVGVIPILVKAVQEQQREIAALKKQISERR